MSALRQTFKNVFSRKYIKTVTYKNECGHEMVVFHRGFFWDRVFPYLNTLFWLSVSVYAGLFFTFWRMLLFTVVMVIAGVIYGTFAKVDLLRAEPQLRALNWAGNIVLMSWFVFLVSWLVSSLT